VTLPRPDWDAVLDEFEAALDAFVGLSVAAHDPGGDPLPPVPVFVPPDGLGPMPVRVKVRAVELSARAGLVEAELIRLRDDTVGQLAAINRPRAVYGRDGRAGGFDDVG
jgi:hypothetical protein